MPKQLPNQPNEGNSFSMDRQGNTPLHRAVRECDIVTVKTLMRQKPELLHEPNHLGETPLHIVARGFSAHPHNQLPDATAQLSELEPNYIKLALYFLSQNAAMLPNIYGEIPLHLAVRVACSVPLVRVFLWGGASIHDVDGQGNTVLHLAVTSERNTLALFRYLIEQEGAMPLLKQPNQQDVTVVELLTLEEESSQRTKLFECLAKQLNSPADSIHGSSQTTSPLQPESVPNSFQTTPLLKQENVRESSLITLSASKSEITEDEKWARWQDALARLKGAVERGGRRALHLMSTLPDDTASDAPTYQYTYVFVNGLRLYYFNAKGKYDEVKIDNIDGFKAMLAKMAGENKFIQLTAEQIEELITSNGGHAQDDYAEGLFQFRYLCSNYELTTESDESKASEFLQEALPHAPTVLKFDSAIKLKKEFCEPLVKSVKLQKLIQNLPKIGVGLYVHLSQQWQRFQEWTEAINYACYAYYLVEHLHLSLENQAAATHLTAIEHDYYSVFLAKRYTNVQDELKGSLYKTTQKSLESYQKEVADTLTRLDLLATYQQRYMAIELCNSARELIVASSSLPAIKKSNPALLNDKLGELKTADLPVPPSYWQFYRQKLQALRIKARKALEQKVEIVAIQQALTEDYKVLICSIVENQMRVMLTPPPCPYALIGLGSMSRNEMGPNSDLEYALLIQPTAQQADDANALTAIQAYFTELIKLLQFSVYSLGETPIVEYALALPEGFHLDTGANAAAGEKDLINTPTNMVAVVKKRNNAAAKDKISSDQGIAYSLLSPCFIVGAPELVVNYQSKLNTFLDELAADEPELLENYQMPTTQSLHKPIADTQTKLYYRRHLFALLQLKADLKKNSQRMPLNFQAIDLKYDFIGPLTHLLTTLALFYNIPEQVPSLILKELGQRQIFKTEFAADYQTALQQLHLLRLKEKLSIATDKSTAIPELENIATRVLYPLQRFFEKIIVDQPERALQSEALMSLKQFDPALDEFFSPDSPIPEVILLNLTIERVQSLAATLSYRQASPKTCIYYYRQTIAAIPAEEGEPNENEYARYAEIWCEQLMPTEVGRNIYQHLQQLSQPNGWRAVWAKGQQTFYVNLQSWFVENPTPEFIQSQKLVKVQTLNLSQPRQTEAHTYYLKKAIADQFFDANTGQLFSKSVEQQKGNHVALPVYFQNHTGQIILYWGKIKPESAATETLVNAIDRRLNGGAGTPLNLVIKLWVNNTPIAVQILEDMSGLNSEEALKMQPKERQQHRLNLEEALEKQPEVVHQIDSASFTQTLLRVLLINPEDDKGDDYFLVKQRDGHYQLKRIDNERAFFEVDEKGFFGLKTTLQVKSQLYCLDHMQQPLDSAVLAEFNQLEPLHLLKSWLQEAENLQKHYQNLFQDKDRQYHFKLPIPSLLMVGIADGLEKELLKRLDAIQGMIRLATQQGIPLTGMQLIRTVQPALANYYQRAFVLYPYDAEQPQQAKKRFTHVTKSLYKTDSHGHQQSNIDGFAAASKSLGIKQLSWEMVQAIAQGQRFSPAQALKRLQELELKQADEVMAALCSGKPDASTRFHRLAFRQQCTILVTIHETLQKNPEAYANAVKQQILQALVGVPFNELTLSAFHAVLTDKLFIPVLEGAHGHLWKLDLNGCWQLTADSWVALAKHCPNLKKLLLHNLNPPTEQSDSGITRFSIPNLIGGDTPLALPQLHTLEISDCRTLQSIQLDAPQLQQLLVIDCPNLKQVSTKSLLLQRVDFSGCVSLTDDSLIELTHLPHTLTRLTLTGCTKVTVADFRERYPFLATFNWQQYAANPKFVSWFDQTLTHALIQQSLIVTELPASFITQLQQRLSAFLTFQSHLLNQFLPQLKSWSKGTRIAAAAALSQSWPVMPDPAALAGTLIPWLEEKEPFVLRTTIEALAGCWAYIISDDRRRLLNALMPLLQNPEEKVRDAAAQALSGCWAHIPCPAPLFSTLIEVLQNDKQGHFRAIAAKILAGSWAYIPDMDLKSKKASGIFPSSWSSWKHIPDATLLISALIPLLKSGIFFTGTLTEAAAQALAGCWAYISQSEAETLLSTLMLLLQDKNTDVRGAGAQALVGCWAYISNPTALVTALMPLLQEELFVGKAAIKAVGGSWAYISDPAILFRALIPLLAGLFVRETVTQALLGSWAYIPNSLAQIRFHLPLFQKEYGHLHARILAGCWPYAPEPATLFSALMLFLQTKEQDACESAAQALGGSWAYISNPETLVNALISLLQHELKFSLSDREDLRRWLFCDILMQTLAGCWAHISDPAMLAQTLNSLLKEEEIWDLAGMALAAALSEKPLTELITTILKKAPATQTQAVASPDPSLQIEPKILVESQPAPQKISVAEETKPVAVVNAIPREFLISDKDQQDYISAQEDDVLLEQAKKESIETAKEQEKIGPRTIAGFNLKDVNDDGNCFYLAVVDQLALIDHPFMHGIPEGTTSNDSLRLFIQGEAFRDREWAGNKEIEILAQKLNLIVAIVDTRTPQAGLVGYYYEAGSFSTNTGGMPLPEDKRIIKIAYNGNHYLSVRSHPDLTEGVCREAFQSASTEQCQVSQPLQEQSKNSSMVIFQSAIQGFFARQRYAALNQEKSVAVKESSETATFSQVN